MDYIDYREKLGLAFSDEDKTKNFLAKAYNSILETNFCDDAIDEMTYNNFCYLAGIKRSSRFTGIIGDFTAIANTLCSHMSSVNDFVYYYSIFINSIVESDSAYYTKKDVISWIQKWAEESGLAFEIFKDKDGYFIFPKGAKELDDALVSEPLEWLNEYPKTRTEFVQALKDYSDLNDDNASDVADKFRKALERFFQEFFGKDKSLENLKSDYGAYMKGKGVPSELSNNLETLLQAYTNFMNGYAKHHSKTNKNLLEYIMYQTGNIIRLLISIKGVE